MKQHEQQMVIEEIHKNDVNISKSKRLENMKCNQSVPDKTNLMVKNNNSINLGDEEVSCHNKNNNNDNNSNTEIVEDEISKEEFKGEQMTIHHDTTQDEKQPSNPGKDVGATTDHGTTYGEHQSTVETPSLNEALRLRRMVIEDDSDSDCIGIDLDDDIERITPTAPPMSLLLDDELDYKHHEVETIIEEDDDSSDCDEIDNNISNSNENNNNNNYNTNNCHISTSSNCHDDNKTINNSNNNNHIKVTTDHNENSKESNNIIETGSNNFEEEKSLSKDFPEQNSNTIVVQEDSKESESEKEQFNNGDVEKSKTSTEHNFEESSKSNGNNESENILYDHSEIKEDLGSDENEIPQQQVEEKEEVSSSKDDDNEIIATSKDEDITRVRSLTGPCPCSDNEDTIEEDESNTNLQIPPNAGQLHLQITYKQNESESEKKKKKQNEKKKTLRITIRDIEGIPSQSQGGAKRIKVHTSLMISSKYSSKNKKFKAKTDTRLTSKGIHNEQLFYNEGGMIMVEDDSLYWLRVRIYGKYGVQTKMVGEVTLNLTPSLLEEDSTAFKSLESAGEVVTFQLSKYLEPRGKVVSGRVKSDLFKISGEIFDPLEAFYDG